MLYGDERIRRNVVFAYSAHREIRGETVRIPYFDRVADRYAELFAKLFGQHYPVVAEGHVPSAFAFAQIDAFLEF